MRAGWILFAGLAGCSPAPNNEALDNTAADTIEYGPPEATNLSNTRAPIDWQEPITNLPGTVPYQANETGR